MRSALLLRQRWLGKKPIVVPNSTSVGRNFGAGDGREGRGGGEGERETIGSIDSLEDMDSQTNKKTGLYLSIRCFMTALKTAGAFESPANRISITESYSLTFKKLTCLLKKPGNVIEHIALQLLSHAMNIGHVARGMICGKKRNTSNILNRGGKYDGCCYK